MKYRLICLVLVFQFGCRSEDPAVPPAKQTEPSLPVEQESAAENPEPVPTVEELHLSESEVVTALEQFGGQITRDAKGSVYGVRFAYEDVGDAQLALLKNLDTLRELDLSGTQVTDAGLIRLAKLTNLQRLSLDYTDVTDLGLRELEDLVDLRQLE